MTKISAKLAKKIEKLVEYINGMGVDEKIALHNTYCAAANCMDDCIYTMGELEEILDEEEKTMSKTLLKKITMETGGGESREYPGTGCAYVLGSAELTEEETAVLTDAEEDEAERNVSISLKIGYDETEVTLEFYKILAAATVRVECDSVEVYGELYYPDLEEIVEAVEALPEEVYAELFDGMTDEEIQKAVVDAGLCDEIDCQCAHVLKAAVEKACKAAGLPFESLEFKPFAMWED